MRCRSRRLLIVRARRLPNISSEHKVTCADQVHEHAERAVRVRWTIADLITMSGRSSWTVSPETPNMYSGSVVWFANAHRSDYLFGAGAPGNESERSQSGSRSGLQQRTDSG